MAYRKDWPQPQHGGQGYVGTIKAFGKRITIVPGDLVAGGQVGAFTLPANTLVIGMLVTATDMETSGSPTLQLSVGDAGLGNRFLNASTIGQTGGNAIALLQPGATFTAMATTGVLYRTTVDTEIIVQASAPATTAAAGTIDVYLAGVTLP